MTDRVDIKVVAAALGISKQACQKRAIKEGWAFGEVPHPGGKKRLYPLASLPKRVRITVVEYLLKGAANDGRSTEGNGVSSAVGASTGSGLGCARADGTAGRTLLRGDSLAGRSDVLLLDGRLASLVPVAPGNQLGSNQRAGGDDQGNILYIGTNGAGEQSNAVISLGQDTALKD